LSAGPPPAVGHQRPPQPNFQGNMRGSSMPTTPGSKRPQDSRQLNPVPLKKYNFSNIYTQYVTID